MPDLGSGGGRIPPRPTYPPRTMRPPRQAAVIVQSPERGLRMSTAGWAMITLGMAHVPFTWPLLLLLDSIAWHIADILIFLSLMIGGVWLIRLGRRHTTPLLPSLRDVSVNERVVLFLRSFKDDDAFSRSPGINGQPTPLDLLSEEDEIGRAFRPFGKMIALGSTSDRLPRLGSERHYASDGTWRAEVLSALDRSTLVVLAIGAGRGLAWEVNELVARNDPARLVLLVSRYHEQYDQFLYSLGGRFPRGLPFYQGKRRSFRLPWSRHVRAAIWFDADWTPHWEKLTLWTLLIIRRRTLRALPRALRRVYGRAGVPLRVPSTAPRPWGVKMSVTFLSHFLIPLAVAYTGAAYHLLSSMGSGAPNWDPGSGYYGSQSTLGHSDPILGETAGSILLALFCLLISASLVTFVYRVWRGGHLAVTAARVGGVVLLLPLLVLALIVILFIAPVGAMIISRFGFDLGGSGLILAAGFILWAVSWFELPIVSWLLLRREVRDWVDDRL